MTDDQKSTGYKRHSQPYQGGEFLKWDDKETIELTVTSEEPESFFTHFIKNQGYPCGGDDCQWCVRGEKPSLRWRVSVLVEGEEETWNMSNQVCDQLESIAEMMGALKGLNLRVRRSGTGLQTRYTIVLAQAASPELPDDVSDPVRARYLERLCKEQEIDFEAERERFVEGAPQGFAERSYHDKLVAFQEHLEGMVAGASREEDEEPGVYEIPF